MATIHSKTSKAYLITGPSSGIGRETAFELAKYGQVVLIGRDPSKLNEVKEEICKNGGEALMVICDLNDINSVKRAADEIIGMGLPIAGLLNNAGISPLKAMKSAQGWDLSFATNYLGPFVLTETLMPHLPDGANVVFIASAVEDPDRKPVKTMGMKGGRFISIASSARGEWATPGTKLPGADAYATSKQCVLAATLGLARKEPRLHFNAVEPGITPGTGLGRDSSAILRFIFGEIVLRFPPFAQYRSTPKKAAKMIAAVLTDTSGRSGIYYDEKGQPMRGSTLAHDPEFQNKVIAETLEFLAKTKDQRQRS